MSEVILVIGATGKTGIEVVKLLTENRIAVRAATRNPSAASSRLPGHIERVEFDFEQPRTFSPALEGVKKVFLMARPGDNQPDKVAIPLIDEAKKKGVRLIVNLTAMGVEQDDSFPLRILEKYIEASGIPFTHLRPNWFMQNFSSGPILADIRATGAFHLPAADAKISFIDVRDIAAVGFAALTEPHHVGNSYTLTGGEALDHYRVASILSRVTSKMVSYVPISEDDARMALAKGGVPSDLIERWTKFFQMVRQGFCSAISHRVESVLGRPATSFEHYTKDYATSWK
jgi:uncharacterized protein YbjT (DUF2867 family)